tara:strand:+ start:322 stop:672 length:351 start_codon:yes stop_codon:yes gene_type:complete
LFRNSITDISGLSLQDFKDFIGQSNTTSTGTTISPYAVLGDDEILSAEGLRLLDDAYISTSMAITVFGKSPVFQNSSPEYDFARGLVYDLFMTNLSLYTELLTLVRNNSPLKHEIN